jgi:transposase
MIQLSPAQRIYLAYNHIDFRRGIDAIIAHCKQHLGQDPYEGAIFLFRNRSGTAIKLLCFDGTGTWLCLKRFSEGSLQWWPKSNGEPLSILAAKELQVLLHNGNPKSAHFVEDWRPVHL